MRGIIFDWSMSAISFVMILRTQFRRDMGLKSFTLIGLFVLGMRVMKELFMA
jgi:hypothetical protein